MKLQPSKDKLGTSKRQRLDGVGGHIREGEGNNPWASLSRGTETASGTRVPAAPRLSGGKRVRPFSDTLGATPPRDGPFSLGAESVAALLPPKTRKKRNYDPRGPWALPPTTVLPKRK